VEGLAFRLNTGYTQRNTKVYNYKPTFDRGEFFNLGSGDQSFSESRNLTVENILRYDRVFADDHVINLTLMYGIYKSSGESAALYHASRQEYAIFGANFDYLNLGTDLIEWGRYDSRGFKDYTILNSQHDLREYYPWIRKADGKAFDDNIVGGQSSNEFIKIRLAETYLLRAEAHFRKGDLESAAEDINAVRSRAQAIPIGPDDVAVDFTLVERAREVCVE